MNAGPRRPRAPRVFAPASPLVARARRRASRALCAGALALAALTLGGQAHAEPAVIYSTGGKFDKSFNEAAFSGAQRWAEETGESFREIELQSEAQREQALRRFAEAGNNPIVMTGFAFGDVLSQVAPDYPETDFAIIDMVVDPAQRPLRRVQ